MDKLIGLVQELRPDITITEDLELLEEGILDSFDIINLIDRISDVYHIEIDPEELDPDNFANVKTIYDLIAKKMKSQN